MPRGDASPGDGAPRRCRYVDAVPTPTGPLRVAALVKQILKFEDMRLGEDGRVLLDTPLAHAQALLVIIGDPRAPHVPDDRGLGHLGVHHIRQLDTGLSLREGGQQQRDHPAISLA